MCETSPKVYSVTHQDVPKLSIQACYNFYLGPESRVWERHDVSPCKYIIRKDWNVKCKKEADNGRLVNTYLAVFRQTAAKGAPEADELAIVEILDRTAGSVSFIGIFAQVH